MEKELIASRKYINSYNNKITLNYYITECTNINEILYGITIESFINSEIQEINKVHALNVSKSYIHTKKFIKMLSENLVTPVLLNDVLEDYFETDTNYIQAEMCEKLCATF